jgi:hypothetical protein
MYLDKNTRGKGMLYRDDKYWEISIDLPQKAKTQP